VVEVTAYYNEFDPYAAVWLRNLIQAGLIAPGDVDERSIVDVRSDDLRGYTQVHFFAGIGGWSLAARLAGWPDDKPLWTGSCPCQPFSAAGKRKGVEDERHLWPVFAALIRECRPAVVAGEQVASKDGLGWLDGVCADLEAADYAWWAGDYCAAGVNAPHIRQRLWWLADANGGHAGAERQQPGRQHGLQPAHGGAGAGLAHADEGQRGSRGPRPGAPGGSHAEPTGRGDAGFWSSYELVPCRDGTTRRIEPGVFPLAHGVSGRVGRLRAYGNAIVPEVGAEILRAYLDGPV
jgi:DNA (cytosine-5)-methyltransferase 1